MRNSLLQQYAVRLFEGQLHNVGECTCPPQAGPAGRLFACASAGLQAKAAAGMIFEKRAVSCQCI
jgi:hypothetical protein